MWPWGRWAKDTSDPAPEPARLPVSRGEWRSLPPIQRAVPEHPLVNPVQRFSASLTSWRDPSFLAPLGHRLGEAEPAGSVADLAQPMTATPRHADLPLVQRATTPKPPRRSIWPWFRSEPVQRAAEGTEPPSETSEVAVSEEAEPPAPAYSESPVTAVSPLVEPSDAGEPVSDITPTLGAPIEPAQGAVPLQPVQRAPEFTTAPAVAHPMLQLPVVARDVDPAEPQAPSERPFWTEPGTSEAATPEGTMREAAEPGLPVPANETSPAARETTLVTGQPPVTNVAPPPATVVSRQRETPGTPAKPDASAARQPGAREPGARESGARELPVQRRIGLGEPIVPPSQPSVDAERPEPPAPEVPEPAAEPESNDTEAVSDESDSGEQPGVPDAPLTGDAPLEPVQRLDPPPSPAPPEQSAIPMPLQEPAAPTRPEHLGQPTAPSVSGGAPAMGQSGPAVQRSAASLDGTPSSPDTAPVVPLIGERMPTAGDPGTGTETPHPGTGTVPSGLAERSSAPETPPVTYPHAAIPSVAGVPLSVSRSVTAHSLPQPAHRGTSLPNAVMDGSAALVQRSPAPSSASVPRPLTLAGALTEPGSLPVPAIAWPQPSVSHAPRPGPGFLVQRQEIAEPPAPAEPAEPAAPPEAAQPPAAADGPAGQEQAAPGQAPGGGHAGQGGKEEPDEMVKKLFDPLLRRLKAELRLDRERRGVLTDRWH